MLFSRAEQEAGEELAHSHATFANGTVLYALLTSKCRWCIGEYIPSPIFSLFRSLIPKLLTLPNRFFPQLPSLPCVSPCPMGTPISRSFLPACSSSSLDAVAEVGVRAVGQVLERVEVGNTLALDGDALVGSGNLLVVARDEDLARDEGHGDEAGVWRTVSAKRVWFGSSMSRCFGI